MPPRARSPAAAKLYRPQEIPLLNPAPNDYLPAQCREVGLRIGDVGVWRDDGASFEVLFNTCLGADDPLHAQLGVPEGFVPFVLEKKAVVRTRYHSPGTVISTGGRWKASLNAGGSKISCVLLNVDGSFQLSFRSATTTTRALPNGSTRHDLLPVAHFHRYVEENAESWYAFATKVGFVLPSKRSSRDTLFVVTGCDKTSSWAITTEAASSGSAGASLTLGLANVAQCTLQYTSESKENTMPTTRVSTNHPERESQCIFVRGFFVPRPQKSESVLGKVGTTLQTVGAGIRKTRVRKATFLATVANRVSRVFGPKLRIDRRWPAKL